MMSNKKRNIAVGTLVGVGVGYLAGLLTAPKSGKATRKDIKSAAVRAEAEAEKEIKALYSDLVDLIKQADAKFKEASTTVKVGLGKAIDQAIIAKNGTKEVLSAIHEGDADDEDLKKAIKNAQRAVNNLKTFINKKSEK